MSDITPCPHCGRNFITPGCMVMHVLREHPRQLISGDVTDIMKAEVASAAAVSDALRYKPSDGIVYQVVVVDGKVGLVAMSPQPPLKEE